jgi:hypothetical protein
MHYLYCRHDSAKLDAWHDQFLIKSLMLLLIAINELKPLNLH